MPGAEGCCGLPFVSVTRSQKGQTIAEVCDVFGDVVETIVSPADGIARIIWTHKVVNTGDPIVKCWIAEPAPPFAATDRFVREVA